MDTRGRRSRTACISVCICEGDDSHTGPSARTPNHTCMRPSSTSAMSPYVSSVDRHTTPSSCSPTAAATSCWPTGIAPAPAASSAAIPSRASAPTRDRIARATSEALSRASRLTMYRLELRRSAVAARMCAAAQSRTSHTRSDLIGELPCNQPLTISAEKHMDAASRGGPRIIEGHNETRSSPTSEARNAARRSLSILLNW
eukprot:6952246-Prymnesium_polylepis.1